MLHVLAKFDSQLKGFQKILTFSAASFIISSVAEPVHFVWLHRFRLRNTYNKDIFIFMVSARVVDPDWIRIQ
jgi:hypothetical protein